MKSIARRPRAYEPSANKNSAPGNGGSTDVTKRATRSNAAQPASRSGVGILRAPPPAPACSARPKRAVTRPKQQPFSKQPIRKQTVAARNPTAPASQNDAKGTSSHSSSG